MKWMVLWTVVNTFMVACPKPPPPVSDYGIEYQSNASTLEMCFDYTEKQLRKEFASFQEASEFVRKGTNECRDTFRCAIEDWKIQRIHDRTGGHRADE